MTVKALSDNHRAIVCKRNDYGTNILKVQIQVKVKILYVIPIWQTACWVDIEVENYWGYIPGHPIHGGCLTLSYQFGGQREVWPPDIFDLNDRINRLYATYLEAHKNVEDYKATIKKQLKRLNA
jgi:hypothetical protein